MSNKNRVRQSFPLYIVGADCRVSAAYQAETSIEGERIIIKMSGESDGSSLAVKLEPETAVRLYGSIGSELKMREEHVEHLRRMREGQEREATEECKAVGEDRS